MIVAARFGLQFRPSDAANQIAASRVQSYPPGGALEIFRGRSLFSQNGFTSLSMRFGSA
jgi:hypothetical protein